MKKHTQYGVEKGFFEKPSEASSVKHFIVLNYFVAYTNVLARNSEVGFADLFAGPGIYENGAVSIPVLVTRKVISDERLRKYVHLWFNEADPELFAKLKANIGRLEGIDSLTFKPVITQRRISKDLGPKMEGEGIPTLVFADPCGYKGLSLSLINSCLKRWGNDVIFFFNYRRVRMKLSYEVMNESINGFFEEERANKLREKIKLCSVMDPIFWTQK